ncbi:DUF4752 family protein [Hafnia paralvei]|uniref:DUF4752 family protein n=1 Tax=Hafnia paralvei TaxID=546367 RepID=UPI001F444584|nr:DUF4752 family protein [Hafnia paralvei]MCE9950363.1 DUF4752 family protein [Hafnia paralvei]
MPNLSTYLNTGLALIGWTYIMWKSGEWMMRIALKQWDKRRNISRKQRAVEELYDAFELDTIKDGDQMKITTAKGLVIMMYRQEKP